MTRDRFLEDCEDALRLPPSVPCTILLISGSLRGGSVNAAVLRTARAIATREVALKLYERLGDLPHFNPDDDRAPLAEAVADLRAQLTACDAVLFSTPEYAGALPGSFKNLLDWTVGGGIHEKSVGWINASMGGAQGTYEQLRTVLTYTNTDIVPGACAAVPVPRSAIGSDGVIMDEAIRSVIAKVLITLVARVAERRNTV
jgi:chromate reductase, NAD(P)H dehydrogenase (quinone)